MTKLDLPIGISSFKDIIQGNFVYVDKTKWIYKLVKPAKHYAFLSRPRRFGKSLTISTLYELFTGNRELFKGTYIYDKWDFKKHIVLRLDMTKISPELKDIERSLNFYLDLLFKEFNISTVDAPIGDKFNYLINELSKLGELVILVDEYDAPLLANVNKPELPKIREIMSNFYVQLKNNQEAIKFIFMTGISRFSKVSIFSKLNNLDDLTLDSSYNEFLGYTEDEIKIFFRDYIEEVKKELNLTEEQFWEKLREWYDGYSWNGKGRVYNPYSILNFFSKKEFLNFWYESGSPSWLVNWVKTHGIEELGNLSCSKNEIFATEIEDSSLPVFLWQTGYLTIIKVDERFYYFDFPNREVKESFSELLITRVANFKPYFKEWYDNIVYAYENDKWQEFVHQINQVIAHFTYEQLKTFNREAHWHALLYLILASAFGNVVAEELSARGRADLIIKHKNKTLVIEIKINKSAKEAIEQIKVQGYAEKYRNAVLMGLRIDPKQRKIVEWVVE